MKDFLKESMRDPWMNVIIFGFFVLVVIGGVLVYNNKSATAPEKTDIQTEEEAPPGADSKTRIIGEDFKGPTIRYTDEGFLPASISLSKEDRIQTSCTIKIVNESSEELLVRLGPPAEKDNRGFSYPSAPKGQSIIIDPRYTGILNAEFYDRHIPSHTIIVNLDPACFE